MAKKTKKLIKKVKHSQILTNNINKLLNRKESENKNKKRNNKKKHHSVLMSSKNILIFFKNLLENYCIKYHFKDQFKSGLYANKSASRTCFIKIKGKNSKSTF